MITVSFGVSRLEITGRQVEVCVTTVAFRVDRLEFFGEQVEFGAITVALRGEFTW